MRMWKYIGLSIPIYTHTQAYQLDHNVNSIKRNENLECTGEGWLEYKQ